MVYFCLLKHMKYFEQYIHSVVLRFFFAKYQLTGNIEPVEAQRWPTLGQRRRRWPALNKHKAFVTRYAYLVNADHRTPL